MLSPLAVHQGTSWKTSVFHKSFKILQEIQWVLYCRKELNFTLVESHFWWKHQFCGADYISLGSGAAEPEIPNCGTGSEWFYKIPVQFFKSMVSGKEPELELEPPFINSASDPGGNLILVLGSRLRLWLRITGRHSNYSVVRRDTIVVDLNSKDGRWE